MRSDDFISKEGGSTGGGTCRKGGMDEEDGGRWGAREREREILGRQSETL